MGPSQRIASFVTLLLRFHLIEFVSSGTAIRDDVGIQDSLAVIDNVGRRLADRKRDFSEVFALKTGQNLLNRKLSIYDNTLNDEGLLLVTPNG
jgi:hypothetical protein